MPHFGESRYTVDRAATLDAYGRVAAGGSATCSCDTCRNFAAARDRVYPRAFVSLLDALGIDPAKDGEAYHLARNAPGLHHYGGWFHFVGSLDVTGDFAPVVFGGGFSSWMCQPGAPRIKSLEELPTVQLEFRAERVPWVLDEPEPA
jgi:hypothetical protein